MNKKVILLGIIIFAISSIQPVFAQEAKSISDGIQPIINLFKDLAEPVAYAFMVKGFLKIMAGEEHQGFKEIKLAISGYIGIQWIPYIFSIIRSISF